MANLKELRNRITSVSSTMQITSAMKMVSAAKLKRAQDAITQMRPYAQKLEEILMNVSATLDASEGVYSRQSDEVKKVLLVTVSSNRGLAGAFNANVVKKALAEIQGNPASKYDVLAIGKKSFDLLRRRGESVIGHHNDLYDDLSFENVSAIAEALMEKFARGEYDRIYLIYNQFVNAAVQRVQLEQMLPVREVKNDNNASQLADYIYEPSKEEILEDLIPKSLKTQLFKAVLDSHASEHGARMTAMHKATDNASELRKQLKLSYNKARQAAITNEILEIVGGAEALNG
ncbi:MAG TPA: ATP synthase F1 subunit gamma [Cryomorphaceae bacterium]|nr:ATP synthase F1 subunit gamma [Owenweeksia sp.]MBF97600.1 ATP synthase F1 subunit gamma [Owenweeksia sp.]HAD98065.1 ATP synthase F1 subunit gamma [Cryomorphaceae bacterium]HBF20541.1 ATP synthase F1 subunit gamma [Cryomorphaceae bacterium]|tara:strand:- start:5741 stop:6607 length:867 start_codon:yes stop_codon:yes gene_type:complete